MNGQGFTLNELLVSLSLSAIVSTIAFPAFQQQLASFHMRTVQADLHAALLLAREAAITGGRPVVLRNNNRDWNQGWQLFVDLDNDTWPGSNEPILVSHGALAEAVQLTSNFGHYARYRRSGRSSYASGAFMAGTWLICSPQISNYSRKLVMSYGGRVRRASQHTGCPG